MTESTERTGLLPAERAILDEYKRAVAEPSRRIAEAQREIAEITKRLRIEERLRGAA